MARESIFDTYRCLPEATYEFGSGVSVDIAKSGGGEVGAAHVGDWLYEVRADGVLAADGADLHCGMPHTHEEMANLAVEVCADDIQHALSGRSTFDPGSDEGH